MILWPIAFSYMFTDIVEKASSNVVRIEVNINGQPFEGTGILIDEKGIVLTCDHVVCPNGMAPQEISVFKQGEKKTAELINFDKDHDLAIIKVNGLNRIDAFNKAKYEDIKIGQDCFVLGYPLRLNHLTLTKSTISAKGNGLISQFPFETFQIDARINGGNSGGPLFTNEGEVIGIVTSKYIPFFEKIQELYNYVNSVPIPQTDFKLPGGFSVTGFINDVNEGIRRMSSALYTVQVGIGWVIPIHFMSSVI